MEKESIEIMSKTKASDPNRLGIGRLLIWKTSDVSAAWVNVITLNFLSLYASDTLGLNIGLVGTLLLVSKIIDAITDVFGGWLVDNTHTKLGKGRPYEIAIVGETVCTILMFSCQPGWSDAAKYGWLFFTYVLTFAVFATLRNSGSTPYTIRAFSNNAIVIRKLASYGGIITMAASMAVSIVFPILTKKIATSASGWTAAVALIMIPATLIGVLRFFLIKEDPSVDAESKQEPVRAKEILTMFRRNKYVWYFAIMMLCYNIMNNLAVGSYFFKWVIGNLGLMGITSIFSIVLLPLMFAFPKIMQKMGSMSRMVGIFGIVGVVGYLICFLSGSFLPGVLFGFLLGVFSTLPLAYYGVLFIMNICTYNEMLGMARMDGSSAILSNFATKTGAALGSWITGILLMAAGYISSTDATSQPASAIFMIRVDYSLIPAICLVVIILCCFAFAKLEKIVPEYEAKKKAEATAAAESSANA
jgi:Na+/melibiose symporter-like transporter